MARAGRGAAFRVHLHLFLGSRPWELYLLPARIRVNVMNNGCLIRLPGAACRLGLSMPAPGAARHPELYAGVPELHFTRSFMPGALCRLQELHAGPLEPHAVKSRVGPAWGAAPGAGAGPPARKQHKFLEVPVRAAGGGHSGAGLGAVPLPCPQPLAKLAAARHWPIRPETEKPSRCCPCTGTRRYAPPAAGPTRGMQAVLVLAPQARLPSAQVATWLCFCSSPCSASRPQPAWRTRPCLFFSSSSSSSYLLRQHWARAEGPTRG